MSDLKDVDLLDPDTHSINPWPLYQHMRETDPLYWDSENELWAVSRWEDVVAIAKDPETFTSLEGNLPNLPPDPSMINQDGRQHTLQRGLVSKGFTPRKMREIEDYVRKVCIELIDEICEKGECDIVEDLALPLPMLVIGDMMAMPREDMRKVLEWTDWMCQGGCGPQYVTDEVNEAFGEFAEYHEAEVEKRKANPGDDLLSIWINAEIDGQKLEEDQLLFEHILLFVGGAETTRSAIAGGMRALLENPEQYEYLKGKLDDQDALERAFEEIVRYVCPFVRMVRTATKDVEMHGKTIKQDDQVMMMYPPATRDPRHFENPDKFDVSRDPGKHNVAFGYGQHFCLGANLARMEGRIMLQELLKRIPDMKLKADAPPKRISSSFLRGHSSVPVTFTPVPKSDAAG